MAEINDYLNGLEEQGIQEERLIQLVNNPVIEKICESYEAWYNETFSHIYSKILDWDKVNDILLKHIKDLKISSEDIKNFSIVAKKYDKQENFFGSGFFISALVNISSDADFKILTEHLSSKLWHLCFKNKKNVTIIGDVSAFTAQEMESGVLAVKGNIGLYTGMFMTGGEIHVSGKIEQIDQTCRGKLYEGGKLIYNGTKNK